MPADGREVPAAVPGVVDELAEEHRLGRAAAGVEVVGGEGHAVGSDDGDLGLADVLERPDRSAGLVVHGRHDGHLVLHGLTGMGSELREVDPQDLVVAAGAGTVVAAEHEDAALGALLVVVEYVVLVGDDPVLVGEQKRGADIEVDLGRLLVAEGGGAVLGLAGVAEGLLGVAGGQGGHLGEGHTASVPVQDSREARPVLHGVGEPEDRVVLGETDRGAGLLAHRRLRVALGLAVGRLLVAEGLLGVAGLLTELIHYGTFL